MSSHHFVKEGQEPALLILDALSFEEVQPLLEWAPFVIVMADAVDDVLSWGIKLDAVLGTPSQAPMLHDMLADQMPVEISTFDAGADALREALLFVLQADQKALNVIATPSEKYFSTIEEFPQLDISLIANGTKWTLRTNVFEKWLPAGSKISTRIQAGQPETHGFAQRNGYLEVLADGLVSIRTSGRFWVGEPV